MNTNTLYAFILSVLAGLSTVMGSFIILLNKKKKIIAPSLSFAAGVMICVSLTDLIPSSFNLLNTTTISRIILILIFISLGVIISMTIDECFPKESRGSDKKLYRLGIISMIAIIMHNIPEGIATFITSNVNIKLGITLTIAIALHNIPEGISIAVPIYHSTNNKYKAILYALFSGLSEVVGALLAYFVLAPFVNNLLMAFLYSIIAGIMIHISIYELLPGAYQESTLKHIIKYFIIGTFTMLLSHLLMK